MGCGPSSTEQQAIDISNKIDENLHKDKETFKRAIKLLLLGAGESGKSTIVKQMRVIHGYGYTPGERKQYRAVVHSNTIQSLVAIMTAMKRLEIEFDDQSRSEDKNLFIRITSINQNTEQEITHELGKIMTRLWKDEGLQHCFSRSREYQLNDSAAYFLNDLNRISKSQYVPTEEDVLKTRVRTTGVVQTQFFYKGKYFLTLYLYFYWNKLKV